MITVRPPCGHLKECNYITVPDGVVSTMIWGTFGLSCFECSAESGEPYRPCQACGSTGRVWRHRDRCCPDCKGSGIRRWFMSWVFRGLHVDEDGIGTMVHADQKERSY